MRIVSYADEHFRTTDAVASALLRYAMLLAHGESSDVVRIPVIVENDQTWAEIIIGPASQITTLEVAQDGDDDDLDDSEVIADLTRRSDEVERQRTPMTAKVADETQPATEAFQMDYPEL
jgi:hypothetical protein